MEVKNNTDPINLIGISGKIGSGKDTVGQIIQMLYFKIPEKDIVDNIKSGYSKVYNSDWKIKKFADKLKEIVALLIGCEREDLESQEFKDKDLPPEWNMYVLYNNKGNGYGSNAEIFATKEEIFKKYPDFWLDYKYKKGKYNSLESYEKSITVRQLLQFMGTEAGRNSIHPNIWVNALFSDYKSLGEKAGFKSYSHRDIKERFSKLPNWIITDMRFPNEMEAIKNRGGITIRVNRDKWKPKPGEDIQIKVFSNWSNVTYTHTDEEGNHCGVGSDGYKYKSPEIRERGQHPSETALDDAEFDYVINNNGTMEDLVKEVKKILIKEKIIL